MSDGFSVSFIGLSLILLLWFCVIFGLRCSAGLPESPITDNPENFGYEDQHNYPILTIKKDGSKYFENDWVPDMNVLKSISSFQDSDFIFIRADARLTFGEVRKTLDELKKYRAQGFVLMAEKKIVEPEEIYPFQEYLLNRLQYCY
jgi:biopolymer transport protein ExbD